MKKSFFWLLANGSRNFRKQKGWSQERLAETVGRTRDAVSNMERGVNGTHIKIAYSIAEALGVPLADLFDFGASASMDRERRAQINKLISLLAERDAATLQKIHSLIAIVLDVNTAQPTRRKKAG